MIRPWVKVDSKLLPEPGSWKLLMPAAVPQHCVLFLTKDDLNEYIERQAVPMSALCTRRSCIKLLVPV